MRTKIFWSIFFVTGMFGLVAQADVTTTVGTAADTYMQDATARGSAVFMDIRGATIDRAGYLRFDLSGLNIDTISSATLVLTVSGGASRNDVANTGRFALYGLNNVAGNTPQNWDEATLSETGTNPVGLEWNGTVPLDLTTGRVTNLDAGTAPDNPNVTETFNPSGGGSAAGTTVTITGTALLEFLNARVDDNGLVTFIAGDDDGTDRGYGLGTKENTTAAYQPALTLTYSPAGAIKPQPEKGATVSVNLSQLSWTNSDNVGKCDVYFGTEPNRLTMDKLTFTPAVQSVDIESFPNFNVPLTNNTHYYWVVDCYKGTPLPEDPNFPGEYWNFLATEAPLITQQPTPAWQALEIGGTAVITAVFTSSSPTPITYAWYKSTDNANNTDTDDVLVGTNSNTLTLSNVDIADAAYYYCKATNPGETRSDPARLSIKRQMAHWKLDGDVTDSSDYHMDGNPHIGDPNYTAGVNATTGQALLFDGTTDYVTVPSGFDDFTPGMTITVWARPTSAANFARFIDFGTGAPGDNIFLARSGTSNSLILGVHIGANATAMSVTAASALTLNEWQMLAATVTETGSVVLYKNGMPLQTGTIAQMPTIITRTSNLIGDSNWTADALYAGGMDDMQIFNFAKSADEVANMYAAVAGNFCRTRPTYDWDNNCIVDLGDLATFAAQWLQCGLYPACPR